MTVHEHTRTEAGPDTSRCECCGHQAKPADLYVRAVPDSSRAHPTDPTQDGVRIACACSPQHADELVEQGRQEWVDEQLWTAKARRAAERWSQSRLTISHFARLAGLTPEQLDRALRWQASTDREAHPSG
ncbi:hypothetical protein H0B56_18135 [Haloechinothrix sp. YIM 98757]|uniref:Uncharacterized protein n=1 Tax=Haloechinothrix aidingensis TaxID=2752311 RepID=A0A838ADU4_9PSEU|nr:hypothetical protein [Haloechinothrix aidingensis]MBA0127469.1 hypothetical protein [Haloechinothrix aidingensis]